jgi:serine-type D-Ala-D-Ala carboxypeptidase (penicillin-binding protein 5/6)
MLASRRPRSVSLPSMAAREWYAGGLGALVLTAALLAATAGPVAAGSTTGPVGGPALASTGIVVDAPGSQALPAVHAAAYLLADLTTGEVLAAKDPHGRLRPASTLKVLTALTLLPKLDPGTVYTAQWADANAEGSRAGIVPDATYTVGQLFQALFLVSGNDAASALAHAAGGGPQTVAAMQATARALGALDTTVRNPSGLDAPGQYTSAYDLAVIARAAMARADFRAYVTTVKAQFPGKMPKAGHVRKTFQIYTQDRLLLNYPGAIGIKTGFTTKARGTFVGAASRGGHTLIATVLHSGTGWEDSAALLTWGFHNRTLARPVGTLDAVAPATTGTSVAGGPVRTTHAQVAAAGAGGGLPWWVTVPLGALLVLVLLRARVLLVRRRRAARRRGYRRDRRAISAMIPAPASAPSATPRTVRVLGPEDAPPGAATGTGTGS